MRLLLAFVCMALVGASARGETIAVAAAISLRDAMTQIAADYEKASGDHVEMTFGSSGQLLAQIKSGAPIDAFISAADAQVDELIEKKLAEKSTRKVVAGNKLVLIVPGDSREEIKSFEALAGDTIKKIAIGEPKTVPAGMYAMQVLKKLKIDDQLAGKLIYGANVRQVLDYVQRGEVSAGIVYATDAKEAGEKVKVVATAEESTHDPIRYPAIIVKASTRQAAAKKFLDYVGGEKGQAVLTAKGFAGADGK
jgi:molybdate transport system substrate-binding protein